MTLRPSILVTALATFAVAGFAATGSFTIDQVMSAPFASSPVAAPTGNRVAWLLNERGQRNIYVASAPDWKGHKITNFALDDGQDIDELAWAPDGSYLLFARGGDFENGGDNPNPDLSPTKPDQSIWSVSMDGSAAKKLTEGRAPAISPKGDIVAFIRGGQIFTMPSSGQDAKNAVTQKATAEDLRWSPDGSELAFVSNRRTHSIIGIYRPADRTLRYLDASVDRDSSPVWSPDGAHIAYIRVPAALAYFGFGAHREGTPWSIRIADANTASAMKCSAPKTGQAAFSIPSKPHNSSSGQQTTALFFLGS